MSRRRDNLSERPDAASFIARRRAKVVENPRPVGGATRGRKMDAFSDILSGVKLNGAIYFKADFSAPWGVSSPGWKNMVDIVAPGAEHLVLYHLIIEGNAVAELADGKSIELNPGDVVVF